MKKNLTTKIIAIVVIILACLYGIFGLPTSKEELQANLRKNIQLGLDLRGGSHMVLQVQAQDAFKAEALQLVERLRSDLSRKGIEYAAVENSEPGSLRDADKVEITVRGIPANKSGDFRSLVNDNQGTYGAWVLNSSGNDFKLTMKPSAALDLRRDTLERTMRTIENRVNGLGLSEASVQARGNAERDSEILVQLPGVDDPARVRQILQTAALLEIAEVRGGPFPSPEAYMAQNGGVMPPGTKLIQYPSRNGNGDNAYYLVARNPVVTGRDLRNARAGRDQFGKFETQFTLGQQGATRFEKFTGDNIGNRLAVVLDGRAYSVATINGKIGDSGVITGQNSLQESQDLALVLRAGSLPAGVLPLEERTVGPSLGADSIRQGLIAGLVGLIAVVAAMLIYYRKAGINATLALILNAIILVACLAYFRAVLTLPGIAGIILTIGMAVDSNVLIFERIREELRAGKSVPAAIDAGFSKAFLTIIDTHITTVVSCAFLFIFGNAQVRGFAVTLVIGLIANVFTAVFVSKVIFDYELSGKKQPATLSI